MSWIELIWRGLCAGLSIGLGGFLFIITLFIKQILKADVVEKLFKLVGSLLFSVGLYMVCMLSLQLYTGKIGLIYTSHITFNVVGQLCVMLMFNVIGSGGLGYACYWIFKRTKILDVVSDIATTKTALTCFNDYFTSFVNSILCGACVFMAVKCYQTKRKPLLMVFIAWFVFSGYEHCIADVFYYTFANAFTLNALLSIIINIVGNSIGPGLVFYMWADIDHDGSDVVHDGSDHDNANDAAPIT